ncbi:hypothetical protein [Calothrix sp. PCC 6303]|uniref:hypothetical protein n=1 Tax=Calothrix sp. PCC 6303 TaxID=1170562 RepID=UPI0002A02F44|nr:hypothetical protein [Calothrix sp. PCC 6303]AFZ03478.1 hypothetical protein Cal6303_4578 [Calothrix sp. PCC 6303]
MFVQRCEPTVRRFAIALAKRSGSHNVAVSGTVVACPQRQASSVIKKSWLDDGLITWIYFGIFVTWCNPGNQEKIDSCVAHLGILNSENFQI